MPRDALHQLTAETAKNMNSAAGVGFRYNGDPCIGIGIGIGIGTIDAMFTIGVSLRFE